METKKQVTTKFIVGVTTIFVSLILGKLVLIPIILFPGNKTILSVMVWVYVLSWIVMLSGISLAGIEGYRLVKHKYKKYQQKTIHQVKQHGYKVAEHTRNAAKHTKEEIGHVTMGTMRAAERTVNKIRRKKRKKK